jgi:hypothetical protein
MNLSDVELVIFEIERTHSCKFTIALSRILSLRGPAPSLLPPSGAETLPASLAIGTAGKYPHRVPCLSVAPFDRVQLTLQPGWKVSIRRQRHGLPSQSGASGIKTIDTGTSKHRRDEMDLKIMKDMPPWEWPVGAGKAFLKVLRNPRADESDRVLAADLAGDYTVVNDELVAALLAILRSRDEPAPLRAQAAISLGPALEQADTAGFEDPDDVPISEDTFRGVQDSLRKLYMDTGIPKEVRRRILEASVRAPQDWHRDAIQAAYASDDEEWKLTAVFSMRWVRGFNDQILEALHSANPDIHYEAVCAAGNWEVDAAWPHVVGLVTSKNTERNLLLAAIDAVASIRPQEAGMILVDLTDWDDEDVVEAAHEAMAMAKTRGDDEFDDEDEDEDEDDITIH